MRAQIDPFTRLILGTAALGALAAIFATIELRRESADWAARKSHPQTVLTGPFGTEVAPTPPLPSRTQSVRTAAQ